MKYRLLLIVLISFFSTCVLCQCDRVSDSLALVALYEATDGENWVNNEGWLEPGVAIENWSGIFINGNGCVSEIRLDHNNLKNSIPPEFCTLNQVFVLDLSFNSLSGSIPSEIGNFENLGVLQLNQNDFTGTIPSEIQNLVNLYWLDLSFNEIEGNIPVEVGSLTKLKYLILALNKITGNIPVEIGNLVKLEILRLVGNQVTGNIPAEIGNLVELTELDLGANKLEGSIPKELGNLSKLKKLRFPVNNLLGNIPPELGNINSLENIALYKNKLSGNIPDEIGNIADLLSLDISSNALEGCIPFSLKKKCNPTYINLTENPKLPWQGDIQPWCDGVKQVGAFCNDAEISTEFDRTTSTCDCAGTPCDAIRDSLALVDMYNSTDGPNWTQKWNLTMPMSSWAGVELHPSGCLKTLDLTNRNLIGTLPSSINQLELAVELTISQNENLGGPLPLGLNRLKFLRVLDVSQNALEDGIPPDLGDIGELEELRINNNHFSGCLPAELSQLANLVIFDASHNNFDCAEFPSELVTLCSLEGLYLGDNGELADDFYEFCSDGSYSSECYFNPDSLYCLEDIYFYAESTPCYSYLEDSTYLANTSIGLVDINDVAYAYITKSYVNEEGEVIDTMRLVGCAGLVCETCIISSDTIVCKRDVLNESKYLELEFQETWNCSLGPVDCYPHMIDHLDWSTRGTPFGIQYKVIGDGDCERHVAEFRQRWESRIDYEFGKDISLAGTIEWWINVEHGYKYQDFALKDSLPIALIFSTDTWYGDVTWPGSTWLWAEEDGTLTWEMATSKFDSTARHKVVASNTDFRFGQWHALGISYGPEGQYLMLDGEIVASNPANDQILGAGGNFHEPLNVPSIGESASTYALNNQREGGFEGYVDKFRASIYQQDWVFARDVDDCPVATNEVDPAALIRVFPNPVSGRLSIKNLSDYPRVTVGLYSIVGKKMLPDIIVDKQGNLNLEPFENGMYVLQFDFGEGKKGFKKIIKN